MHNLIRRVVAGAFALALSFTLQPAQAAVAVDPNDMGPLTVTSSEYKLPAKADPEIDPDTVTELWARIYRPKQLGGTAHPLVVMLHGNHATCGHHVDGIKGRVDDDISYTFSGTCPDGYVVVPSHEGYEYVARRLASWGYVVVSINANRGVNAAWGVSGDEGLNLRRGRLVLRHLQQLDKWNTKGGAPASLGFDLQGTLDFSQIGMMGHSRGGEGMIAAYTLYNDPGSEWPARFKIKPQVRAIFELAPVDGQTARTFTADNIPWNVLLPLCDGDVSDLEGVRVYDRTFEALAETHPAKKSVYAVWGANHNFFNSQWQQTDSFGCEGPGNKALFKQDAAGSSAQRLTGSYGMMAFFRGHVGEADASLGQLLDPAYALPAPLAAATTFERSFGESAATRQQAVVEAFDKAVGTNTSGNPNDLSNIDMSHGGVPDHDFTLNAGAISWDPGGADPSTVFFQANWTAASDDRAIGKYETLEFRIARRCDSDFFCSGPAKLNKDRTTDFDVALVAADGSLSTPVHLSSYAQLAGPVGVSFGLHPIMQTVRVPIADFGVGTNARIHGVRFTFDRTSTGAIYLADVRVSRPIAAGAPVEAAPAPQLQARRAPQPSGLRPLVAMGKVVAVHRAPAAADMVEIELEGATPFPVRDALPVLRIGDKTFRLSRFPNRSSTFTIAFAMSRADFDTLPQGAEVVVESGAERWGFGKLDKRLAQ